MSSLLNRILGEKRASVSDVAGTTRDAIDTPFEKDGQKISLSTLRVCANAAESMKT